jgi:hypothetical protein
MRRFSFLILIAALWYGESKAQPDLVGTILSKELAEEDVSTWKKIGQSPIYIFDRTYGNVHLRGYIERTDSDLKDWHQKGFHLKVFLTHISGKLIEPIPIAWYSRYMMQSDVEVYSTTYIYSDERIVYVNVLDQSPHFFIDGQPTVNDSITVKTTYALDPQTGQMTMKQESEFFERMEKLAKELSKKKND